MEEDMTPIRIPAGLVRRAEAALGALGHPSVEAFVAHVVRAALSAHESAAAPSPDDEAQIVERLKRLGYID
jgi:hypothetical protein